MSEMWITKNYGPGYTSHAIDPEVVRKNKQEQAARDAANKRSGVIGSALRSFKADRDLIAKRFPAGTMSAAAWVNGELSAAGFGTLNTDESAAVGEAVKLALVESFG